MHPQPDCAEVTLDAGAAGLGTLAAVFVCQAETFPVFMEWLRAECPGRGMGFLTLEAARELAQDLADVIDALPDPVEAGGDDGRPGPG